MLHTSPQVPVTSSEVVHGHPSLTQPLSALSWIGFLLLICGWMALIQIPCCHCIVFAVLFDHPGHTVPYKHALTDSIPFFHLDLVPIDPL